MLGLRLQNCASSLDAGENSRDSGPAALELRQFQRCWKKISGVWTSGSRTAPVPGMLEKTPGTLDQRPQNCASFPGAGENSRESGPASPELRQFLWSWKKLPRVWASISRTAPVSRELEEN